MHGIFSSELFNVSVDVQSAYVVQIECREEPIQISQGTIKMLLMLGLINEWLMAISGQLIFLPLNDTFTHTFTRHAKSPYYERKRGEIDLIDPPRCLFFQVVRQCNYPKAVTIQHTFKIGSDPSIVP